MIHIGGFIKTFRQIIITFSVLLLLQLKPFNKTKRKVTTRVLTNRLATEVFADDFMRHKLYLLKDHAQLAKTPLKLTKHRSEVLLDHVI